MATVAASMYATQHYTFRSQDSRATTLSLSQVQQPSQQQVQQPVQEQQDPPSMEEQFTTLFCRALYDYDAQDASALSFRRGDIIEVLSQQPSGWWDGLLGDERGWFPSNYVHLISDEEAEMALTGTEYPNMDGSVVETQRESMVDMSHAMLRGGTQADNEEWLDGEVGYANQPVRDTYATSDGQVQSSDFWVPQVTSNGQIYYVNTQTGQQSRDLPQETTDDVSDSEFAGLTSQSSSRSGTSAGLAFGLNDDVDEVAGDATDSHDIAGFGVPRRTGTPEPWIRRLADDGMSYYYYNKLDGKVIWTRPEAPSTPAQIQNSASQSSFSSSRSRQVNGSADPARLSAYSDDSEIHPLETTRSPRGQKSVEKVLPHSGEPIAKTMPSKQAKIEFESAQRIARSLQQALTPPPPELITELSAVCKGAIQAVVNNIQLNGLTRRSEEDYRMDDLIFGVVLAVRNLLYVSAIPTSQIPNNVLPREVRDAVVPSTAQSPLKPAQRKVTATLSRLVLSARAMQYDSGSVLSETLNRIELDAEELEKAVLSFVLEVQRHQNAARSETSPKRLHGVFSPANIGLGLVGAGAAGRWKGFGWVSLEDGISPLGRVLGPEVISEITASLAAIDGYFSALVGSLQTSKESSVEQVRLRGRELIAEISSLLVLIEDVHIARHVDIDGIRHENGSSSSDPYSQTVENARLLVRTLEVAVQSIYDDCSSFLVTLQSIRDSELDLYRKDRDHGFDLLDAFSSSLGLNLKLILETLDSLLSIGHNQADIAEGDYNGSIDWRMSQLSMRPITDSAEMYGGGEEDVVDMMLAFGGSSKPAKMPETPYRGHRKFMNGSDATFHGSQSHQEISETLSSTDDTLFPEDSTDRLQNQPSGDMLLDEDDPAIPSKSPPRPSGSSKLKKLLGDEYAEKVAADLRPWYLRPNYSPSEIIIDPDNSIRGGTVPALIERLTAHEQAADPTFIKAFLMTYKSFTTLDELFDLLVARFRIQPPPNLTPGEREEWGKLKQHVIQMRVMNTFKIMVTDDAVLEKEDMYILERMKAFVSSEEVSHFAAAKQLSILIERAQRGNDSVKMVLNSLGPPPPPLIPKTNKKLKLSDIEPLELARQLTLYESQLYQKIKPMECLQRAREQKTENMDNIATVIQTSNKIADWVAESILSKEDSRKRANIVKHLILVADRCRTLNNFSTMIAITSGLNTPPIRRLKRTWEQVSQRCMAQFGACEMTIDSNKNFTKYRQLMASVNPPCVPFIGVFLSTLQFIQDGNPDTLPGGLVNFRKRQKASEVINDIKRWQAQPFNFLPIPSIRTYIQESLDQFNDTRASSDRFWALSLDREPREREDEKMARLLQESGFL